MKFFSPLKIFVVANLMLLVSFPFFPAIGQVSDTLVATPESVAAETWAWGWSWLTSPGMIKWLVYIMLEGLILVGVFMAFWKQKT